MKNQNIFVIILILFSAVLILMPAASAYSKGFPMMNVWDVFVENIFGSFFVAVIFICLIFYIILMVGNITHFTNLIFMMFFVLSMALGYGGLLVVFIISFSGFLYFIYQLIKFFENR